MWLCERKLCQNDHFYFIFTRWESIIIFDPVFNQNMNFLFFIISIVKCDPDIDLLLLVDNSDAVDNRQVIVRRGKENCKRKYFRIFHFSTIFYPKDAVF